MTNFYKQKESRQSVSNISNQNITNKNGMSDFFNHPHYTTHNNTSTRHIMSPLVSEDGGLGPETTYKMKGGLGSGYTYKRKEPKQAYLYGFTNSRFIYFLGIMDPRTYLIFVTLIALLILEDLNQTEGKIIFAFISNVADSMQTIIEQEVILNSYNLKVFQREQGKALQKDFDTLYSEINRLKKEISHLQS